MIYFEPSIFDELFVEYYHLLVAIPPPLPTPTAFSTTSLIRSIKVQHVSSNTTSKPLGASKMPYTLCQILSLPTRRRYPMALESNSATRRRISLPDCSSLPTSSQL